MHNLVLYVSEHAKFPSGYDLFIIETYALCRCLFMLLIAVLYGLSLPSCTAGLGFGGVLKNTILRLLKF